MRVISKAALTTFWRTLPVAERRSAEGAFRAWYAEVAAADWGRFQDIKRSFNTADWVGNGKAVFDIGGNKYRIVALAGFKSKRIFILFVGSHKQYDAINVTEL